MERKYTLWKAKPRKPTEDYLHRGALFYLERYSATAEMVRRVLQRRVERAFYAEVITRAELEAAYEMVERVVKRTVAAGLVNDQLYAEARVLTLLRRGKSPSWMAQYLSERGISKADQKAVLDSLSQAHGDRQILTLAAAHTLARKRRIGPYRPPDGALLPEESEEESRRKLREMGIMARAGFDYQTAEQVLNGSKE